MECSGRNQDHFFAYEHEYPDLIIAWYIFQLKDLNIEMGSVMRVHIRVFARVLKTGSVT